MYLILGPSAHADPPGVYTERVESAREMLEATRRHAVSADVFLATAAVSDFAPARSEAHKLKRNHAGARTLDLVENPDILARVSHMLKASRPEAVVVGFAAETEDLALNAREKLDRKGCDLLVANRVGPHEGFGSGKTTVEIFDALGRSERFGPSSKASVAKFILDRVAGVMNREPDQ